MIHLALDPDESTVEYLERLTTSLRSSGGYTIDKIEVNIWPALHKGTVTVSFVETPELTAIREDKE